MNYWLHSGNSSSYALLPIHQAIPPEFLAVPRIWRGELREPTVGTASALSAIAAPKSSGAGRVGAPRRPHRDKLLLADASSEFRLQAVLDFEFSILKLCSVHFLSSQKKGRTSQCLSALENKLSPITSSYPSPCLSPVGLASRVSEQEETLCACRAVRSRSPFRSCCCQPRPTSRSL